MIVSTLPEIEGYVTFEDPSLEKEARTWYRVVGDLSSGRRPLVTLHGGPGAGPSYLTTPFDKYAATTGTPVIYYDQIGNGKSTHFREKRLDEEFWTVDLFLAELDNLLRHLKVRDDFDLYGQSWGAMMCGAFASSPFAKGSGLHRIVMGSGPCRMEDWVKAGEKLVAELPEKMQEAIRKASEKEDWNNPEYKEALMQIYKVHMCRLDPWPQILLDGFEQLESDDTVYMTMEGPDEIHVTGNLRDFDLSEACKSITVPCLIINGEFDQCDDDCARPWFEGIPKAKWITIPDGSHMVHLEQPERYAEFVWNFLK